MELLQAPEIINPSQVTLHSFRAVPRGVSEAWHGKNAEFGGS